MALKYKFYVVYTLEIQTVLLIETVRLIGTISFYQIYQVVYRDLLNLYKQLNRKVRVHRLNSMTNWEAHFFFSDERL